MRSAPSASFLTLRTILGDFAAFSQSYRHSVALQIRLCGSQSLASVGQRTGGPGRNDRHVVVACHLVQPLTQFFTRQLNNVKALKKYEWFSEIDYSTNRGIYNVS